MTIQRLLICITYLSFVQLSYCQNSSEIIYLDGDSLTYVPFSMEGQTNEVNIIPDFSHAGYMGGGVPLPTEIAIQVTVTPEEGDDSKRIQEAIDQVEALEPDQNGFRGVVLVKAGHYSLENLLTIRESGVVLRGEGQGLDGTVLHSNPRVSHSVISIFGASSITVNTESNQAITTEYVPVGSHSFEVEDASFFAAGDNIVVVRTPNQAWIDTLGMDQVALCQGKADCRGWEPSVYTVRHERRITAISGNAITIDMPIVDVMEENYGGGYIAKIESSRRLTQCGVENMRIQSFYDSSTDESHAWTGVRLADVEHCWVKQVTGQYLSYSTVNVESANFTTVQDCAYINPRSKVTGGRRYSFAIQEGVGNLFQRCFASSGRHDFVTGSRVTGPNVFLDGLAKSASSDIGPHHRWATGTLFDNIRGGSTRVWNRGNSGTGHGWSGAQTLFWNIDSYGGEFRVDSPHGSINWGIGCIGTNQSGDGYWESWGEPVLPRSLYIQQLQDRLGDTAVNNVIAPEQLSGEIIDDLNQWAGYGDFSDGGPQGEKPTLNFEDLTGLIDVSLWQGGDITVSAADADGTVEHVRLLINGEPIAIDNEAPYLFADLTTTIQSLSHTVHYLQAIATDNDGNTSTTRIKIVGGDPPTPMEEEEEMEERLVVKVFPNPTQSSQLTIEMKEDRSYQARILDLQGRMVDQFNFEGLD